MAASRSRREDRVRDCARSGSAPRPPRRGRGVVARIDSIPPGRRPPSLRAQSARFRARLAAARGAHEGVEQGFKTAAGIFREHGLTFPMEVTELEHGEWLVAQGRGDEAESCSRSPGDLRAARGDAVDRAGGRGRRRRGRGGLTCGSCGVENPAGRKFCTECGAALAVACSACGAALEGTEKFCGECGSPGPSAGPALHRPPKAPPAERSLAPSVCRLVGFTTLSD